MLRFAALLLASSIYSFAAVDSGLLSLVPSDSQTVASLDVESSRTSGFGQFMLRQMSHNETSFQELIQKTGFDPRRDLQMLLVASLPATTAGHDRGLVLARGLFNQELIAAQATTKGMVPKTISGSTIYVSNDKRPVALAFPETGVVAFGDRAAVEQVLGNRANPSTLSADLQSQIAAVSQDNEAWFASTVPANRLVGHVPQADSALGGSTQNSQVMQAVQQSGGGMHFGDNVLVSFHAQTRSDQDATSLTDFLRFISSTIQMQRQNDPRAALLAPAIDSMQLRSEGNQVYSSLTIPENALEQLLSARTKPAQPAQ